MRRNAVSVGSILFLIAVLVAVLAGLFVFVSVAPTPRSTPSGQASPLLTATPSASATLTPSPTPSPTIEPTPGSSSLSSALPTLPPVSAGTTGSSGSSGLIQIVLILLLALIVFGALWLFLRLRRRLRQSWHPTPAALETPSEPSAAASLLGRISAIRRSRPARQKAAAPPKSARMRFFHVVLPLALTVVLLVLITPTAFDVVNNSLTPLWNSMSPSDHNLIIIMLLGLMALLAALEAMAVQMRHRREEEEAQASARIEFKLGPAETDGGEAAELSELDRDLLRPKPFVPASSLSTLGRSSLLDRLLSRSRAKEPLQLTGRGLPRSTRGWRRLFRARKQPPVSVYEELTTDATGLPGDFLIGLSRRERLRTRLATARYRLAQTLRHRPVPHPGRPLGLLPERLRAHARASLAGAGVLVLILVGVVVLRFAPGLSLELAASVILFVALAVGAVTAAVVYGARLRALLRRRREASVLVSPAEASVPVRPAPQISASSPVPAAPEMEAPALSVSPQAAPIIETIPVPVAATASTPAPGLRQRLAALRGRFSRPRPQIHRPARPRPSLPRRSVSISSAAAAYAHFLTALRSSQSNRQIALIGGVLVLAILAAIGATRLTGGLPIEMAALVVMFVALVVLGVILARRAFAFIQKARREAGRPAGADIPDFVVLEVPPFTPVLDPFADAAQLIEPEPVAEIPVPDEEIATPTPVAVPVLRRRPPRWALASGAAAAVLLVLAFGVVAVKLGSPSPSPTNIIVQITRPPSPTLTASSTNSAPLTPGPTASPTPVPTASPTPVPTASPTPVPTASPTPVPTASPTPAPTASSTPVPTASPTPVLTASPTPVPTASPTPAPTASSTPVPTASPTPVLTASLTPVPTASPSGIVGTGGTGGTNAGQWLLVFLLLFIFMVLMLAGPLLVIRIRNGSFAAAIRRLRTAKRTASSVEPRAQTPHRGAHIKQSAVRSVVWVGGFLVALGLAVRHGVSRAANAIGTALAAMRHQISSISLRRTPSDLTPISPASVSEKEPAVVVPEVSDKEPVAVVPEVSVTPATIVETVPPSGPKTESPPARRRPSRRQAIVVVTAALCVVGALAYFGARGLVSPQISPRPTATQTSSATASAILPTTSPTTSPGPTTSPSPSSTPSPSPSPAPTATPIPTATPSPTPAASPTSVYEARRAALPACSGVSACHVYTVVAGDSLSSIANYYGVSLAQLEQYNPQITTPDLIYADTAVRIPG